MPGTRRKPGAMAPFVDGYRDWLLGRGYSPATVIRSLIALGHLGRWMEQSEVGLDRLDDAAVRAFVASHVRTRSGRPPHASVAPLLAYLRAEGVVAPEPPAEATALDELIERYRRWLSVERGLASETVRGRIQTARRFLANLSEEPERIRTITGGDVTRFLLAECERVPVARPGGRGGVSRPGGRVRAAHRTPFRGAPYGAARPVPDRVRHGVRARRALPGRGRPPLPQRVLHPRRTIRQRTQGFILGARPSGARGRRRAVYRARPGQRPQLRRRAHRPGSRPGR
jgi:hypothetical protein